MNNKDQSSNEGTIVTSCPLPNQGALNPHTLNYTANQSGDCLAGGGKESFTRRILFIN